MELFQTDRLYLRELTPDDAEQLYLLNLDPDVIKYTGDVSFETIADARFFLKNYTYSELHRFGRWAVIFKEEDVFLGWCGIKYTENTKEFDIGFRFFKKYWNTGYATEAAKACLDFGFENFQIPEIIGRVKKENLASIAVLRKIGLSFYKNFDFEGSEGALYKIKNNV